MELLEKDHKIAILHMFKKIKEEFKILQRNKRLLKLTEQIWVEKKSSKPEFTNSKAGAFDKLSNLFSSLFPHL